MNSIIRKKYVLLALCCLTCFAGIIANSGHGHHPISQYPIIRTIKFPCSHLFDHTSHFLHTIVASPNKSKNPLRSTSWTLIQYNYSFVLPVRMNQEISGYRRYLYYLVAVSRSPQMFAIIYISMILSVLWLFTSYYSFFKIIIELVNYLIFLQIFTRGRWFNYLRYMFY